MKLSLLFILLRAISVSPMQAQDREPIKVMFLGTTHLDNPGRDTINMDVPDVLTRQKQKELKEVRDALAKFSPNKVALEVQMKHQSAFDSLYQEFRKRQIDTFSTGDFVSKRSEQFQIGFKLADRFGHDHVYALDHYIPMEMGKMMEFAKKHEPEFLEYFKSYKSSHHITVKDSLLQNGTLLELYQYMNTEQSVKKYHEPYVRSLSLADDSSYVGADVIADYHRRNLRIFANLLKIAEPGDRIFMMFGAGHSPFIRPLIKDSPRIEFVDPMDYL
ncbi:DUF5694 domain-containing protein [Aliifodinibius salicampi]|uniref:DUF5694 domain-containing protein n=1 Tax=Fodinibius salicampi TaxID=1920655 RepID=A0ABT3PU60_9BACT|nr:DUF5694 domain-containing protein [Fodinibius salicampi]MCW9711370.1 DUF5694 domain-containing protein [Fodinibius salicampi]